MVEPILLSIATTLATKAAGSLYDVVRSAFRRHPAAMGELAAAEGAGPDSPPVLALATRLAEFEAESPEFHDALRAAWGEQHADHGGVNNQITGNVSGKVVQARDIHGDTSF